MFRKLMKILLIINSWWVGCVNELSPLKGGIKLVFNQEHMFFHKSKVLFAFTYEIDYIDHYH